MSIARSLWFLLKKSSLSTLEFLLKVRAALEEKLKQKGIFSSITAKSDRGKKYLPTVNGSSSQIAMDTFELGRELEVVKKLPPESASKEPVHVDCRKHKGQFDYIESVLPSILQHRYISNTPAASKSGDRYPQYPKAAFYQAFYNALRLDHLYYHKFASAGLQQCHIRLNC